MRYKELVQEKAELVRELRAIQDKAKGAKLTDDDKTKREQLLDRLEDVNDELKVEEQIQAAERSMEVVPDPTAGPQVPQPDEPQQPQAFASFGEQLQAVYRAAVPENPFRDPRLVGAISGPISAGPTGMGETVSSDGGFLVSTTEEAGIERRMYEQGQILSRCRRRPIGANANSYKTKLIAETSRADGSRWGGVRAYWTGEAAQFTASNPTFEEFELRLDKLTALVYVTDEELADAVQLEATINDVLPQELTFKAENAVINGGGAGMPTGVIQSGAAVTQAKETGQAAATILYENINKMWSRMWGRSRMNMAWFVDQSAEPALYSMSQVIGTGGVPVFLPANGVSGQPFSTLFGRPIIPHEHGAALGTVGDIMGLDLSQYLLIEKGGIQRAASMHVRFVYDEMAFRFVYRLNGKSLWRSALTPKSGGNTLSPYVLLATRA